MTSEQIQQYREDLYKALCDITEGKDCGISREDELKQYRHIAFERSDAYIEECAEHNTPLEIAEFETM